MTMDAFEFLTTLCKLKGFELVVSGCERTAKAPTFPNVSVSNYWTWNESHARWIVRGRHETQEHALA